MHFDGLWMPFLIGVDCAIPLLAVYIECAQQQEEDKSQLRGRGLGDSAVGVTLQ